jgi:hypothetical protein
MDSVAARLARRLGEGAIGAEASGAAVVMVPDPDAPGRRRRLEAAVEGRPVALGPTVDWAQASTSARRAVATHQLAAAGRLHPRSAAGSLIVAEDHLADLLIAADPEIAAERVR